MSKINKTKKYIFFENIIYLVLWLLVFFVPFLLSIHERKINWVQVLHEFLKITPYFLIFLIHNFFLFKLIIKRELKFYLLLSFASILTISTIFQPSVIFTVINIPAPPPNSAPANPLSPIQNYLQRVFTSIIFSILTIGLNAAIKLIIQWAEERRKNELLEHENTKNELQYLKNQISPHFFMNTLNNIHALIDYDKEIAKNSVIKLSKLMRVVLYENDNENYTLKKEIDFLNDYIELMKIRVNPNVDIKFNYPEQITDIKIAPFLFINLVENAFKHGIKAIGNSFIHINLIILDEKLIFNIKNSKTKTSESKSGNIGLENTKKRFELIYKNNCTFDIIETDDTFEMKIVVKLTVIELSSYRVKNV